VDSYSKRGSFQDLQKLERPLGSRDWYMGHLDAIHWEVGLMALMKRDHVVLFMCKNGIFLFNMCERDFFLLLKSVGFF